MPETISIVGSSGSGKTTLLEKLIPEIKARGYRVGVIKHASHGFEMDQKGKDSWKYEQAGADTIMVASSNKFAMVKTSTPDSLEYLEKQLDDMDLIITEGFKRENRPKIEIFRREHSIAPVCRIKDNLIALVTDSEDPFDIPVFDLNDIKAVADFIEDQCHLLLSLKRLEKR